MKMGKHEEPKDKQISSHCITAIYIYICLWRWKLAAPEQLSAWTIGTDHVIIAERIFSSWVAYPLCSDRRWISLTIWVRGSALKTAGSSSFIWTKLDTLPFSQILQVRVMQCEQWAPTGRNINLHLWHGGRNKTLSEPQCSTEVCSVCACHVSTFEITNLNAQNAMWTAISSCGAPFLWWEE